MNNLKLVETIFVALCMGGVAIVGTGMYLDDLTFWFISDMYFIAIFTGSAVIFYLSLKQRQ